MLIIGQTFQQTGEQLGISLLQCLLAHHVAKRVTLTCDGIAIQVGIIIALTLLRIITTLQDQLNHLVVCPLVCLGMLQQILQQGKGLGHVLLQSGKTDNDILRADIHIPVASQLIELLTEVSSRHLVCAQIFKIVGSNLITVVGTLSEVIEEHEVKQAVGLVLQIIERQFLLGIQDGDILFQVYEMRQNRLHLRILDSLHKGTLLITIGLDRGDGRLVDLLLQTVDALLLEDGDIALGKELVGKVYQLLLGDLRDTVDALHLLLPVYLINKGINKHIGTTIITLQQGVM